MKKIIVCVLFLFSIISLAEPWQVDADKSNIQFTATQNGSPITGEFKSFTEIINFDPNNLAYSNIKISIDMSSVNTSYQEVADTLKTAEWFDVKLFPTATFTSYNISKTGKNTFAANGKLTLCGKTEPLTVNFTLNEYSDKAANVTGTANLKRTDFAVGKGEWANTKEIKDEVSVAFKTVATKK